MAFEFTTTLWDGQTCTIGFWVAEPPPRPGGKRKPDQVLSVIFAVPRSARDVAGTPLGVDVRIPDPMVTGVALERPDRPLEPLEPLELQRFPWARWLDVAREVAEHGLWSPGRQYKAHRALRRDNKLPIELRRPGRRGHPPEFFERIYDRHRELRQNGETNTARRIADEEHVALSTAQGWVKRAKEKFE